MQYLDDDNIQGAFEIVYFLFDKTNNEKVPRYEKEIDGIKQLQSTVERARLSYYPDVFDKAVHLLIEINTGHYFSNGNKRLSLVLAFNFLRINSVAQIIEFSKKDIENLFVRIFPESSKLEDYEEFSPIDLATYNLSILVAKHTELGITHEDLKVRVKVILQTLHGYSS